MTFKSKNLELWIEGAPRTLIHNGMLNEDIMRSELMTRHELAAALRGAGCTDIEHVRVATLENNGQITVSIFNPMRRDVVNPLFISPRATRRGFTPSGRQFLRRHQTVADRHGQYPVHPETNAVKSVWLVGR